MIDRGKHNLLGIGIDAVDYDAAVERIITSAKERRGMAVSALAVHGVTSRTQPLQRRSSTMRAVDGTTGASTLTTTTKANCSGSKRPA